MMYGAWVEPGKYRGALPLEWRIVLQAVALVLMVPEARIARVMEHLFELGLIEVVDTVLETELQRDLSNIIIKCQYTLAQHRSTSSVEQHLLGLVTTLSECIMDC